MNVATFVEQDCTIEHEGRKFTAGGAVVSPDFVVAYVGKLRPDGKRNLDDWHGNKLGSCHLSSSWHVNSYIGSTMYQIYATVNGTTYTGRGFGEGMSCNLRRVKGKE